MFQFSQESSVKVRVHVAVDPVKKLLSDVIGKEKVIQIQEIQEMSRLVWDS